MPGSGTTNGMWYPQKGSDKASRARELAVRWLLPVALAVLMSLLDQKGWLPRMYLDSEDFYATGTSSSHVSTMTSILTVLTCVWAMADLAFRVRRTHTAAVPLKASLPQDQPVPAVRAVPGQRIRLNAGLPGGSRSRLVVAVIGRTVQLIMTGVFLAVVATLAAGVF